MVSTISSFDSQHEDMIHDVQMDYYGRRVATCSSDKSIRIFEVEGETNRLVEVLKGHDGPVWQVSWAHPKFGNILASCSYDGKVNIWKENNNSWSILKEHKEHQASVNSISWGPHEFGLMLACASSDGKISILQCKADGQWECQLISAHRIGCNSVSFSAGQKRFVSGGCDNSIKIWKGEENEWKMEKELKLHTDWVRDVAWANNIASPTSVFASCSQDRQVFIWKQDGPEADWKETALEKFPDVVWRVSWSVTGTLLAVSCGDGKVYLFKETLGGEWEKISEMQESDAMGQKN